MDKWGFIEFVQPLELMSVYSGSSTKKVTQLGGAVEYTDKTKNVWRLSNECPDNDTKQWDGEVPVMQEIWGMRSTPSLTSLPGPL